MTWICTQNWDIYGLYLWIRAVGPCEETEGCIARASGKLWKSKNAAYLEKCGIVGTGRCEFCCKKVTTSRNTNSWKYNSYWNIGLLFSEARKQIKGLWNDLRSCQTKFCLECKCPFTILFAFAPFLHPPILSTLYKRIIIFKYSETPGVDFNKGQGRGGGGWSWQGFLKRSPEPVVLLS